MFEFNEDDLKANKRGQLRSSQRDRLKSITRGARSFSWTNSFIAIGFAFLDMKKKSA